MNRGDVMQKSAVQQMMGGSSNWWSLRPPISQQVAASATHLHHHVLPPNNLLPSLSPSLLPTSTSWNYDNQDQLPESLSQLLLGGCLVGGEDKSENLSNMEVKKLENEWDEQAAFLSQNDSVVNVNQKNIANSYMYEPSWSQMTPVSSPKSCVTTVSSSNMLDFSNKKLDARRQPPDHSSECNSRAANKKARVQSSSAQCTFKVRKEKLGDRITALHQLVSPFGKTDTASVLLEAIGYIRFLQSQIEALSLPYLGSGSRNMRQQHQQQAVHEKNSLFPEDPGQLSNENCLKRKANSEQDLQSRGLCLVPLSCTLQVESDNGADYWAPAFGGGFR